MTYQTAGMVCAHHHLYSSLARGMPAPPATPNSFLSVLENIWWRLDAALDLETIYWSAALGAAEALLSGTTAIIDHHESPFAIEGSLSTIKDACDLIGVRSNLCYGITDRWVGKELHSHVLPSSKMTDGARRGLEENIRFLTEGNRGMIGIHAAFTCSDETLETATQAAIDADVGVHIHVAEGQDDVAAGVRLEKLSTDKWLLIHSVHLDRPLQGTIVHNPRSNMNNSVGYGAPTKWSNNVALGTDGIGADMLEEARLAYVRLREYDLQETPDTVWGWLRNGQQLFPEVANDVVTWSYDNVESGWHVAFTPGIRCLDVDIEGVPMVRNGKPLHFDLEEIRAKAAEAATRLFNRLN